MYHRGRSKHHHINITEVGATLGRGDRLSKSYHQQTPYCSGCDYTHCDYYNESSPDEMQTANLYVKELEQNALVNRSGSLAHPVPLHCHLSELLHEYPWYLKGLQNLPKPSSLLTVVIQNSRGIGKRHTLPCYNCRFSESLLEV